MPYDVDVQLHTAMKPLGAEIIVRMKNGRASDARLVRNDPRVVSYQLLEQRGEVGVDAS